MSILDDLANEASSQFSRAKATLLGGSGTPTPPVRQEPALTSKPVPNYDGANKIEQLAQRSGATDAAFAKAQQATRPTYTAPSAGANPNVPPGGSAEANAYRASQAAEMGPRSIAGEAVAPRNVPLNATLQKGIDAAKATFAAQMPSLPSGDGLIARGARFLGNAGMGAAKTVARVAEPVIEGARIAQVAMDPTMSKKDVAQQAVEGGTRWGATAGGAALGAGLGAMTGPAAPVLSPVGGVAGGIAGYIGGDELVSRARAALGLGDKSPAERSSARLAAASPVAAAAAAAPAKPAGAANVVPGANGSTVQVNPDGSAQLATRPTSAPAAAAAAPTARPTVSGEAKAGTKKKSSPRPAGKAGKAAPAAAAAAPAASDGSDGSEPSGYGVTYADGSSYWVDYNSGVATPSAVEAAGKGQEYRDALIKGQVQGANPNDVKLQQELEKQKLINEGRIEESKIGAGATVGAASIRAAADERSSKYSADKQASAAGKNIILQDEAIDDGMGGTKIIKRAYHPDGTPVGVTQQGADGRGPSGFQNGAVYRDPKTGVSAKYNNGKWEPVK